MAYLCCLHKAGFELPNPKMKYKFSGNKDINDKFCKGINPNKGITIQDATIWFENLWGNYYDEYFVNYQEKKEKNGLMKI